MFPIRELPVTCNSWPCNGTGSVLREGMSQLRCAVEGIRGLPADRPSGEHSRRTSGAASGGGWVFVLRDP